MWKHFLETQIPLVIVGDEDHDPTDIYVTNNLAIMHALSTKAAKIVRNDTCTKYLSPSPPSLEKGATRQEIPTSALQESTLTWSIPLE